MKKGLTILCFKILQWTTGCKFDFVDLMLCLKEVEKDENDS